MQGSEDFRHGLYSSQLFYDDISALLAEKAPPTPAEGYLMSRGLAAFPTPDLHVTGIEIRILLQRRDVEENVFLISRRAKRNQTFPLC